MVEFLQKLLQFDYNKLLIFLGVYLLSLWVLFCVWVFVDSQKRFKNFLVSIFFFFAVLILNLPAIIFYLIIRPAKDDDNILLLHSGSEEDMNSGINVPIVNFVGNDGIELTLQIKINKHLENVDAKDMKINVDWTSKNEKFKVQDNRSKVSDEILSNHDKYNDSILIEKKNGKKILDRIKEHSNKSMHKIKDAMYRIKPENKPIEIKKEETNSSSSEVKEIVKTEENKA